MFLIPSWVLYSTIILGALVGIRNWLSISKSKNQHLGYFAFIVTSPLFNFPYIVYGVIYAIYITFEQDPEVRQIVIRFAFWLFQLAYLVAHLYIWRTDRKHGN